MSEDYKAAFRAAQAQRGLAAKKPTKEQLKALKAKKVAPAPATYKQQPVASAAKPAAGLPTGFFDEKVSSTAAQQQSSAVPAAQQPQKQQQNQQVAGIKRPAAAVAGEQIATGAVAVDGAVPKGFFDDKAEDKKARGVKEPGKQDKEAAFAEFSAAIDTQLKQQAAEEDEEAEEAARDREEREAFEQRMRMKRAAELKALKSNPAAAANTQIDAAIAAAVPAAGKKRRVVDVLQEVLGADSEDDSDGDEGADDPLLDWRAKTV